MFKKVVIVSDGIKGHYHQSLGIAGWIERISSAKLETLNAPKVSKLKVLSLYKTSSREWLKSFGIQYEKYEADTLFVSTGSKAAPFCLALAKATGNKCAVVMTPSILGTKPFDYAIVPEHDKPDPKAGNVITTLGAPNHIYIPSLKETASEYFAGKNLEGQKVVAILIGGSDANYKIDSKWARDFLTPLLKVNAKFLITTSRRTGEEVENMVEEIFSGCPNVELLLLFSRTSSPNSIAAILGASTHVLVTEDSVSMVSEAVTAGFKVGLVRVPRTTGKIKDFLGFGARRFDEMFEEFAERGLIEDFGKSSGFLEAAEQKHGRDFNEAKRAAEWILHAHTQQEF